MPAAYASEAQRRGWRGELSRGPRGAGCGVKARGPARGEANKGGTVVGNALMTSAQKRPQGLKPHTFHATYAALKGRSSTCCGQCGDARIDGAAGICGEARIGRKPRLSMPALDDPAGCVSTGTAGGGQANKTGTVVGNALMTSAQKRPQGLKPSRLPRDLRGPEGPLFHGAAGIWGEARIDDATGSAATPALDAHRVSRGPHWTIRQA
jgi:hypothetical protein